MASYPFWPSDVPDTARADTYSERPQRNVATFQPDAGIPIERRRTSISSDEIAFTTSGLTSDQYDALIAWFRVDLKDGVLPFQRYHPRTGDVITCKFTEAPYVAAVEGLHYSVSIKLMRLP